MPTYLYRCPDCHRTREAIRRIADRDEPLACLHCILLPTLMERVQCAPLAVRGFTPYRAVAEDKDSGERPMIRSRAEHEAFLRRNGYEEIGNDKSMTPPSIEEFQARRAAKLKEERELAQHEATFNFNEDTHEATT